MFIFTLKFPKPTQKRSLNKLIYLPQFSILHNKNLFNEPEMHQRFLLESTEELLGVTNLHKKCELTKVHSSTRQYNFCYNYMKQQKLGVW